MPGLLYASLNGSEYSLPTSTIPIEFPLLPPYHEEFYFADGNLTLLVEDTLYRVFRSTFTRHSSVWRDLYDIPGPIGLPAEGSDDEHPLVLHGVFKHEFERLLWIIYPCDFGAYRARTQDDWTSILDLATRWEFNDIRALAIRELQKLEVRPVDAIVLSRKYDIGGRWTLAAYAALCQRADALTLDEAGHLGLETTVRIAQLRERVQRRVPARSNYHYQAPTSTATRRAAGPASSYPSRKSREPGQPADTRPGKPSLSGTKGLRKPSSGITLDVYRLVLDVFGGNGAGQTGAT
ncbi:hypothetical protein FOMPIDRAFT_1118284 [Fomitopsis schrenkii]|uniref:BTB domain-containing protein n=1 Tax=Fomitopsis schrenkii TaxID=2126942 RepID=S8FW27_FOMSC|nr:hypothetical protein FOMPIDRAFT_1118284 [Fomitopsis schrenkii]